MLTLGEDFIQKLKRFAGAHLPLFRAESLHRGLDVLHRQICVRIAAFGVVRGQFAASASQQLTDFLSPF